MTAQTTAEGTSDNTALKEQAVEERGQASGEVPEYAHRLDNEFSIKTPKRTRSALQGYFQNGWDDRHRDGEAYWLGEGLRCFIRNKTVWRVKTAEEAVSLFHRLSYRSDPVAMMNNQVFTKQNQRTAKKLFDELLENVDIDEIEAKLEDTEYGEIISEMREAKLSE